MDEIKRSGKDFLIPTDIAGILGVNPHAIRIGAANGTLRFPYIRLGTRTKIPRIAFIKWMEGDMHYEASQQTVQARDAED